MLITDELLLNYQRCQRRVYLNVYGNSVVRDPERDFLIKLRLESENNVVLFVHQFYPEYYQPQAPRHDYQTRAQETIALMQQGVDCIYQGCLYHEDYNLTLVGRPHLLIKQPGESDFGNYAYFPMNIHLGRRAKPDYKLLAAFYAYLLGKTQGVVPKTSEIVLRRQNRHNVDLSLWLPKMLETLSSCRQKLLKPHEPEVFISRQRCSLCRWYSYCQGIAKQQQHLSLVPGVTPNRYEQLRKIGIHDLESLAGGSVTDMGKVFGAAVARELQQQALSISENRPLLKPARKNWSIPQADIEFYFDIEAEPEREIDFLLGVLMVNRQNNQERFLPFLAEQPEEEAQIWQEFLNLVNSYPGAPIFHYSEYEVETIKRLGHLYQTPKAEIDLIISRSVDLHNLVVKCLTLPVHSYSLKSVANWLGFHWRDVGISGDQSVCWYDQWLKGGDRTLLESILRYNEDDCRATRHLKDYLVKIF